MSIFPLLGALFFYFTNCAGGLPDNVNQQASANDSALSISVIPAAIAVGQSANAIATGGTPPYTYSVIQGTAAVDSVGAISGVQAGNVQIQVVDATSATAIANLTVAAVGTLPSPTPMPAPAPAPVPSQPPPIVCDGAQPGLFQQGTLTTVVTANTEAECLAGCAAHGAGVCDWRSIAPFCYWTPAGNVIRTDATPYWVLYTCH